MKEKWNNYKNRVYTQPLHPIQEKETKQAFYAGAMEGLNVLIESMEKGRSELELQGDLAQLYKQISGELKDFIG